MSEQAFTLLSITRITSPGSSTLLSAVSALTINQDLKRIGIKADATGTYFDPIATATSGSEPIPTTLLTWPSNIVSAGLIRVIGDGSTHISVYQFG